MREDADVILKSRHKRLIERITLCVEPELKELYDVCMEHVEVAEDLRRYMRERLPLIRNKIQQEVIAS